MKKTMKMKKTFMQCLMLLMVAIASITTLSSCHKDDEVAASEPTPQPAKPTTYTIMLYGCGGRDLDDCLDYNLNQLDAHGKPDRVNFTALVKFSHSRQKEATTEGTRLFTLTSEGMKNEKVHDVNFRLDNPAHLTQFIKDSKEKMPADKYILIFWNHGEEFGLSDKLPENKTYDINDATSSRSILFDDNVDEFQHISLSAYEIEKAIKDSGTKLDLIYMDLCNYGMAEVYYQLKDCTRYMMAAAAPTPGIGGNYTELMEDLQNNDSLTDAIKEYIPNCVNNWKTAGNGKSQEDLECYDLSYMDEFTSYLKGAMGEYANIMKQAEKKQKEYYDSEYNGLIFDKSYGFFSGATGQLFTFSGVGFSVDVCSAFTRIAGICLNGEMSYYATMMKRVLDKMTVAQAAINLPSWMNSVSMGIMWPTNRFISYMKEQNEIGNNLKNAALYKATGWGDLLANTEFRTSELTTSPMGASISMVYGNNYNFKYTWQYEVTADLSNLDKSYQEHFKDYIDIWLSPVNNTARKNPSCLCMGKYGIYEALEALYENMFINSMLYDPYKLKKFKIKAYITDAINPADPFKDKYPAELEQEVDIREYIKSHNGEPLD